MHLKRWITGIIALPILVFLVGPGPRWLFFGFLCVVSVAGQIEFHKMVASNLPKFVEWSNYLLSLLFLLLMFMGGVSFAPAIIAFWALVPMALFMLTCDSPDKRLTGDIGRAILGPVYVCLPLGMLVIIDRYPEGNIWIFFLLSIIFAGDTFAFYIGRLFGKHKLHWRISPGKTWEGAVGGVIGSLVAAILFLYILPLHQLDINILILALTLSVTGQIGDLAESLLKRNHGIKDSGNILPGHGGILDRIDSLLFSIPIFYLYLSFSIV